MNKRSGQTHRSGWARRQLERLLHFEGDALDLIAIHEASIEMNIPSPIVEYREAKVPHLIPRIVITKKPVAQSKQKSKPKKKATSRSGYVYVFKSADGKYKLGRARNVERRLQNLKVGSPMAMTLIWKYLIA